MNKRSSSYANGDGTKRSALIFVPRKVPKQIRWKPPVEAGTNDNDAPFLTLDPLMLSRVLGFAVGESSSDYLSFLLVNKEWKQMVETQTPPVVTQIKQIVKRISDEASSPGQRHITSDEIASLLPIVLASLERPTSALYRIDGQSSRLAADGGVETWPTLQPHYSFLLSRFLFGSFGGSSQEREREICEIVTNYLTVLAGKMIQKAIFVLQQLDGGNDGHYTQIEAILKEMLALYTVWDGIHYTTACFAGQIDTLDLSLLMANSKNRLITTFLKAWEQHESTRILKTCLEELLQQIHSNTDANTNGGIVIEGMGSVACATIDAGKQIPDRLLLQTFRTIGALLGASNVSATQREQWIHLVNDTQIQELYSAIRRTVVDDQEQEAPVSSAREGRWLATEISIAFPDGTSVVVPAHFLRSSNLLKHLNLQSGDVFRWDRNEDRFAFQKAMEFYALDEETPLPVIELFASETDENFIVQQYAAFADSLDPGSHLQVFEFSKFLRQGDLRFFLSFALLRLIMTRPSEFADFISDMSLSMIL